MKSFKYILFVSSMLLLASCFSDKSTDAVLPLSEITISGIDSIYDIDKNVTLKIEPVITQTNKDKALSYTWEINLDVFSQEKNFVFVGTELGRFNCRLIVENEDGKSFFPFVVNVNSPYEYGLTVLSEDGDGKPMLSFMQEPMKEGDIAEFTDYDCFAVNNQGMPFASRPTDIVQTSGSIIVSCRGNDVPGDGDDAVIYFLNDKTFLVENSITSKEYPTFSPTKLLVPSQSAVGISYPVLSADGKVYYMPTYDAILQPSTKLLSTYAQSAFVGTTSASYYDILFWDKERKGLSLIYNAYGPYYCGSKYLLQPTEPDFADLNYFKSVKDFVLMSEIRRTPEQSKVSEREVLVLLEDRDMVTLSVVLPTFFWNSVEGKPNEYVIMDNGGIRTADFWGAPVDENTPCVANKTYTSFMYAQKNKVKRWYYTSNIDISDADDLLVIDNPNAVITAIEISEDHQKTYVAFYDPTKEGLNGSVWVIDTDKGTVLDQYDNICYKPVKVIYKKR